jgi:hypothetical protein
VDVNPKAKMVNVIINQTQSGQPFDVTLELGMYTSGSVEPKIETVKVNKTTNTFSIPIGTKPTRIVPDPNTLLLFEEKSKK